ncbi:hydrogenase accessory protein [Gloeomargarita lithophora Alchichica-D10]|uniref:Hydrogenase accessory protein n=1 Tax=Gloeomargarita lithophora Alchichica-D10 TaxID=1188229 RepID=A0A1J0A9S3_9CYAN|nr:HupE/UreJ family protein [Gloeomargarita lithophora]APB32688.1 hydrogenase accessory protein [Gloeomargarita lithophora Alchichica-D10]
MMILRSRQGRTTSLDRLWIVLLALIAVVMPLPALAHHPMDGEMPTTWAQGFLSGLAHPVIGFDHLAFIVAAGLLGVTQGLGLPVGFVLGGLAGTGLHLASVDLPGVELGIAGSLVLAGILLVQKERFPWWRLALGAMLVGLLHGYAYGEAIIGAEMTPLMAYLLGFTLIQLAIALGVWGITRFLLLGRWGWPLTRLNPPGWVIVGIGLAFLVPQMVALILPVANN